MGLLEVLPNLRRLAQRMDQAEADILARRPDVLVTIDAPSFTLRLAERVRPRGIRVVHYVAPQVWAWRPGPGTQDRPPGRPHPRSAALRGALLRGGRHPRHLRRPSGAGERRRCRRRGALPRDAWAGPGRPAGDRHARQPARRDPPAARPLRGGAAAGGSGGARPAPGAADRRPGRGRWCARARRIGRCGRSWSPHRRTSTTPMPRWRNPAAPG